MQPIQDRLREVLRHPGRAVKTMILAAGFAALAGCGGGTSGGGGGGWNALGSLQPHTPASPTHMIQNLVFRMVSISSPVKHQ